MAAPTMIDPTKPGKYSIVLSDALLGKPTSEAFTGVRCEMHPQPQPAAARRDLSRASPTVH